MTKCLKRSSAPENLARQKYRANLEKLANAEKSGKEQRIAKCKTKFSQSINECADLNQTPFMMRDLLTRVFNAKGITVTMLNPTLSPQDKLILSYYDSADILILKSIIQREGGLLPCLEFTNTQPHQILFGRESLVQKLKDEDIQAIFKGLTFFAQPQHNLFNILSNCIRRDIDTGSSLRIFHALMRNIDPTDLTVPLVTALINKDAWYLKLIFSHIEDANKYQADIAKVLIHTIRPNEIISDANLIDIAMRNLGDDLSGDNLNQCSFLDAFSLKPYNIAIPFAQHFITTYPQKKLFSKAPTTKQRIGDLDSIAHRNPHFAKFLIDKLNLDHDRHFLENLLLCPEETEARPVFKQLFPNQNFDLLKEVILTLNFTNLAYSTSNKGMSSSLFHASMLHFLPTIQSIPELEPISSTALELLSIFYTKKPSAIQTKSKAFLETYIPSLESHASFIIFQYNCETRLLESISYCDGNLPTTQCPYGEIAFQADLSKFRSPNFRDEIDASLTEKFEKIDQYQKYQDLVIDALKDFVVCDETGNPITTSHVKTKAQNRGNCTMKAFNIVIRSILQKSNPEQFNFDTNPLMGNDLFKQYKTIIRRESLQKLMEFCQPQYQDLIISDEIYNALGQAFLKSISKGDLETTYQVEHLLRQRNVDIFSLRNDRGFNCLALSFLSKSTQTQCWLGKKLKEIDDPTTITHAQEDEAGHLSLIELIPTENEQSNIDPRILEQILQKLISKEHPVNINNPIVLMDHLNRLTYYLNQGKNLGQLPNLASEYLAKQLHQSFHEESFATDTNEDFNIFSSIIIKCQERFQEVPFILLNLLENKPQVKQELFSKEVDPISASIFLSVEYEANHNIALIQKLIESGAKITIQNIMLACLVDLTQPESQQLQDLFLANKASLDFEIPQLEEKVKQIQKQENPLGTNRLETFIKKIKTPAKSTAPSEFETVMQDLARSSYV